MKIVAEYEQTGGEETQEAFARRKQIKVGTFRYWLYKGREARNDQPVHFALIPNKSPGRLTFADVTLERGAAPPRTAISSTGSRRSRSPPAASASPA